MVSAEGGPREGCLFPSQLTRGSGERRELPQRGLGQSPGWKCILKATEPLLFVHVSYGDALSNLMLEILKPDKI